MWLTKNEKKVLKLLIDDAKLSDTFIANKLNISSQAIGRIRKKLEEDIIKNYTLELDLSELGINSFFMCKVKLTPEGKCLDKKEIEKHETRFHWANLWGFLIRYVTPVAVAFVFLAKFF